MERPAKRMNGALGLAGLCLAACSHVVAPHTATSPSTKAPADSYVRVDRVLRIDTNGVVTSHEAGRGPSAPVARRYVVNASHQCALLSEPANGCALAVAELTSALGAQGYAVITPEAYAAERAAREAEKDTRRRRHHHSDEAGDESAPEPAAPEQPAADLPLVDGIVQVEQVHGELGALQHATESVTYATSDASGATGGEAKLTEGAKRNIDAFVAARSTDACFRAGELSVATSLSDEAGNVQLAWVGVLPASIHDARSTAFLLRVRGEQIEPVAKAGAAPEQTATAHAGCFEAASPPLQEALTSLVQSFVERMKRAGGTP